MRDWQRSLATETADAANAVVSETKTPNVSPQVTWAATAALLVFALLFILRPPFVESAEREKPLQPRRLQWPLIVAASASAGALVLLAASV